MNHAMLCGRRSVHLVRQARQWIQDINPSELVLASSIYLTLGSEAFEP